MTYSSLSGGHPGDIAGLAVHGDYLYWTDRGGHISPLGRVDKMHFGHVEDVLPEGVGGVHSVLAANQTAETSECSPCGIYQCDDPLPNMSSVCVCACMRACVCVTAVTFSLQ